MTEPQASDLTLRDRLSILLIGAQWGLRAAKRRAMRPGAWVVAFALLAAGVIEIRSSYPSMEDRTMSILARFTPANVTTQKYDQSLRRLEEAGNWPPDGLEYHVAFGPDNNLRVSEIWDSPEQFEEFGKRLMPLLADIGIEPGEPEMLQIHNIVKR